MIRQDFQQINDVFGHSAGEELLIGVSATMIAAEFQLNLGNAIAVAGN